MFSSRPRAGSGCACFTFSASLLTRVTWSAHSIGTTPRPDSRASARVRRAAGLHLIAEPHHGASHRRPRTAEPVLNSLTLRPSPGGEPALVGSSASGNDTFHGGAIFFAMSVSSATIARPRHRIRYRARGTRWSARRSLAARWRPARVRSDQCVWSGARARYAAGAVTRRAADGAHRARASDQGHSPILHRLTRHRGFAGRRYPSRARFSDSVGGRGSGRSWSLIRQVGPSDPR